MTARVTMAVLLFAALAGCGPRAPERDRNVVIVAIRTPPNNLDPRQANDETSQRIGQLVFSCLLDVGDDLRVVPRLASRLDNPDPLTYVAHLRRGVRFHDGRELTSKDVVYTYADFLDPAFISPFKGAFRVLQSVRALDDYTVEFKLKEPFAAFPAQLAGVPPIVPAGSGDSMRSFPIGTGPYRFVSAQEDVVTLAAFEGYFDGLPNNAGIVLKVVPDDTMRGLELRKGSVDVVVNDLPPDMVHQLETSGAFAITRDPGLDFSYLGFNMRDPLLRDKRVRHAIGYAINRDAIVTYLRRGLARPTPSVCCSSVMPGAAGSACATSFDQPKCTPSSTAIGPWANSMAIGSTAKGPRFAARLASWATLSGTRRSSIFAVLRNQPRSNDLISAAAVGLASMAATRSRTRASVIEPTTPGRASRATTSSATAPIASLFMGTPYEGALGRRDHPE